MLILYVIIMIYEAIKRKVRRFEKIYNKTNPEFNYNNCNTICGQYRQLLNHTKTCFIKGKINSHGKNTRIYIH